MTAGSALGIAAGIGSTDSVATHHHGPENSTVPVALGGTPVTFGVDIDLISANIPIHTRTL